MLTNTQRLDLEESLILLLERKLGRASIAEKLERGIAYPFSTFTFAGTKLLEAKTSDKGETWEIVFVHKSAQKAVDQFIATLEAK